MPTEFGSGLKMTGFLKKASAGLGLSFCVDNNLIKGIEDFENKGRILGLYREKPFAVAHLSTPMISPVTAKTLFWVFLVEKEGKKRRDYMFKKIKRRCQDRTRVTRVTVCLFELHTKIVCIFNSL